MGLARFLGVRRKFTVDGVRYRELSSEPLRRALSRKGSGAKPYEVTFPGNFSMRIEATARRAFADISGPSILDPYKPAQSILRPGMRLVILQGGTGAVGHWAARLVGPAGAVVALDRDEQSIAYARRRYIVANVSYERGSIDALSGETDGAFDGAIAVDALEVDDDPVTIIAELWRITGPRGAMLVGAPMQATIRSSAGPRALLPEELASLLEEAIRDGPRPEQVSVFRRSGRTFALARQGGD